MAKPITRAADQVAIFRVGAEEKSTKSEVNYRPGTPGEHCGICTMFRSPNGCTAVAGDIDPEDLCDYFERQAGQREAVNVMERARARKKWLDERDISLEEMQRRKREKNQPPPEDYWPLVAKTAATGQARYIVLPQDDPEYALSILQAHGTQMTGRLGRAPRSGDSPENLFRRLQTGGFTLHDHSGNVPTSGYMVSMLGREQAMPMAEMTPQHIADYQRRYASDLAKPGHHLGAWLTNHGGQPHAFLDVSRHFPQITPAIENAARNNQLGIYDLGQNVSVMPSGGTWLQGNYNGGYSGYRDHDYRTGLDHAHSPRSSGVGRPTPRSGSSSLSQSDPGEPRALGMQVRSGRELDRRVAHSLTGTDHPEVRAPQAPGHPRTVAVLRRIVALSMAHPDPATLQGTGKTVGTHGGEIVNDPATGTDWLMKPSNGPHEDFMPDMDVAANQIATQSGLEAPESFLTKWNGKKASAQVWYPGSKMAFGGKTINPEKITDPDLLEIQKHHALDWLIGNHDSHGGQFLRDQEGHLVGIDKGQGGRYFNSDRLHWNYHPNSSFGESEPIYNTLYRNYATGGREIFDPREGDLGKYIQGVQDIPDDEYRAMLTNYAQNAAKAGALGAPGGGGKPSGYAGHNKELRFPPNDVEGFLQAAVDRKNNLMNDMGELYRRARAHRVSGLKIAQIAKLAALPDPETMWNMHETVGSHGSQLWGDPQGEWVIKKPNKGNEFLVPLDVATANLQRDVGLESPETYAMPFQGGMATAVKMYPNSSLRWSDKAFPKGRPPGLKHMTPDEQLTVQKHHAMDWLIANHDAHVGNWLNTDRGLVGIDKGQAMKYFGQDKLDYKFQPNYYAKEPIYNRLWKDFARGKPGEMLDPREGELGEFIKNIQSIPDWKLRQQFAPYAHAAANAGMLGTGVYGKGMYTHYQADPNRGLHEPDFQPNDAGQFLDALVARKNSLMDDLGAYYDKTATEREYNLANPQPERPKYQPKKYDPGLAWWKKPSSGQTKHWAPPSKPWYLQPEGAPAGGQPSAGQPKQLPFGKPKKKPKFEPSPEQQAAEAEDLWDWGA